MSLSNPVMDIGQAMAIAGLVKQARARFGKNGAAPVEEHEVQSALLILFEDWLELKQSAGEGESALRLVNNLKQENTKLKQQLAGHKTANKKLKAQIEDMTDANPDSEQ